MQQCNLVVYYFLRIFDTIGRILKNVRTGKYKMKFLLQCRVHMFLDTNIFIELTTLLFYVNCLALILKIYILAK